MSTAEFATKSPEYYREQAAQAAQRSAESFERSDTDGFLSQWAGDMTAGKYRALAELAEAGGMIETSALFDLAGNVISTHHDWNQYGEYWVLNDEAAEKFGKRFVNPSKARKPATERKNNAAKGFAVGTVKVRGLVTLAGGSGTGLSGAAGVYVTTVPAIDDLREGNYEVVSTDALADEK